MNEKPMEWIVEAGESAGHKAGRIATLIIAVIIFVFYTMTGLIYGLIGVIVFASISGWLQMHANVEYEFFYFDDEMEITPIYNRTRRGKKMRFSVNDIEYMVKKAEPQEITKYFCKKKNADGIYTLVLHQEGKRTAIVMDAKPEFAEAMEKKHKVR